MKHILSLLFMIICFVANAQDTIFLKNGEEIKSKRKFKFQMQSTDLVD
jgi:hypothetical protein